MPPTAVRIAVEHLRRPGVFIPYTRLATALGVDELLVEFGWSIDDLSHFVCFLEGTDRFRIVCDSPLFDRDVVLDFSPGSSTPIDAAAAELRFEAEVDRLRPVVRRIEAVVAGDKLADFRFSDVRKRPVCERGSIQLASGSIAEAFADIYSDRMFVTFVGTDDNNVSLFTRHIKMPRACADMKKQQMQPDLFVKDSVSGNTIEIRASHRYRENVERPDPVWSQFVASLGRKTVSSRRKTTVYWFHIVLVDLPTECNFDLFENTKRTVDFAGPGVLQIRVSEEDTTRLKRVIYLARLLRRKTENLGDIRAIESAARKITLEESDKSFYKLAPFLFRSSREVYTDADVYASRLCERIRSYQSAFNRLVKSSSDQLLEYRNVGKIRISRSMNEKVIRYTVSITARDDAQRKRLFGAYAALLRRVVAPDPSVVTAYTFAPDPPSLLANYKTKVANSRATTILQVPRSWAPHLPDSDMVAIGGVCYIPYVNLRSNLPVHTINVEEDVSCGRSYPKVTRRRSCKQRAVKKSPYQKSGSLVRRAEFNRLHASFEARFDMPVRSFARYGTKKDPNSLLSALVFRQPLAVRTEILSSISPVTDLRLAWRTANTILQRCLNTSILFISETDTLSWAIPVNANGERNRPDRVRIVYTDGTAFQPVVQNGVSPDLPYDTPFVKNIIAFYRNLWKTGRNRAVIAFLRDEASPYTVRRYFADPHAGRVYLLQIGGSDGRAPDFFLPVYPEIVMSDEPGLTHEPPPPVVAADIPAAFRRADFAHGTLFTDTTYMVDVACLYAASLSMTRCQTPDSGRIGFLERNATFGGMHHETIRKDSITVLFNNN